MTSSSSNESANLMSELYFQLLDKLSLRAALDRVPFNIQQRRSGFTPSMRCMALLAAQAQECLKLTDWGMAQRQDSRLKHWLGGRTAPHCSTLSRTLAATDEHTVRALRQEVLVPLSEQVFVSASQARGRHVFLDIDNQGFQAEGETYEGTAVGRMGDGTYAAGYRLHLISLANCWPIEMEWTAANAHAIPSAMVMVKRLVHRLPRPLRDRVVFRGDSSHGSVGFIRFLQRYQAGYLLKCCKTATARRWWAERGDRSVRRIVRPGHPDLLAVELGPTQLVGKVRRRRSGRQRRRQVQVPRVVVYRQEDALLPAGTKPKCFALLTTLSPDERDAVALLHEAYLPRCGDIENIFCQLDQAFQLRHLRSRSFHGNWTFVLLCLIAATLTQMIRQDDRLSGHPMPVGLKETLDAAATSGLRLRHAPDAGCMLAVGPTTPYTTTFQAALQCSYQYRFRYVA